MKRSFALLLSLSLSCFTGAQSFEWLNSVSVDYEFNPGMIQYTTASDPDGGSYLYGIQEHIAFYNQSMGNLFLKKYNASGQEEWNRTIEGQSNAGGIFVDKTNNIYFYGQMYMDANFWNEDSLEKTGIGTDGFLAKATGNGDLEWCINLTTLPMGEGTVANLTTDDEGLLYLAYSTWINSYVLIFNPEGEHLYSVVQEDVGLISGIDLDEEGNIYVAGSCAGWNSIFNGVSYPAPFSYTTYLVKYSPLYQPLWVKYIEDVTCTFPLVKADGNGWIYFAGALMTSTNFDTILVNGPEWVNDFFLTRVDPMGNFQWVVECPETMTGDATAGNLHFLDVDREGNALLTGTTRGIIDWENGVVTDVADNYQDIIVWSYNTEGVINWAKTAGGEGYDQPHTISACPDGSASIAGVISGTVVFDSINRVSDDFIDPFLTRLDLDLLSRSLETDPSEEFLVYPNPAAGDVYVAGLSGETNFELYNIAGFLVMQGQISATRPGIRISGLNPGIYSLVMKSGISRIKSVLLAVNK